MDNELTDVLDEHIPYRLKSIDLARWACELLSSGYRPATIEVHFDAAPVLKDASYFFLTNPIVEMGAVYCRVLLEFLGVGLSDGRLARRARRLPSDVGIEHYGLNLLTVEQVSRAPMADPQSIIKACTTTIEMAHRAVAHLTRGRQPDSDVSRLHLCCSVVPWLISEHVYRVLERELPPFRVVETR